MATTYHKLKPAKPASRPKAATKPPPAARPKPAKTAAKKPAPSAASRPAKVTPTLAAIAGPVEGTRRKIRLDQLNKRGLQMRVETDADRVTAIAEAYRRGETVPDIRVFEDPETGDLYLVDGHHRAAAAKRADLVELDAVVSPGTYRDAVLAAATGVTNHTHGLPFSNADKRKIVSVLLADAEWKTWSNREIAAKSRVSEAFVRSVRRELGAEVETIKRRDGTTQAKRGSKTRPKLEQQSLFSEHTVGADTTAEFTRTHTALVAEGSSFDGLHADKCAILAALHVAGRACNRAAIAAITGKGPDVHLAGLAKKGLIDGWPDSDCTLPATVSTRIRSAIAAAQASATVPPSPQPEPFQIDPQEILDELLGAEPPNRASFRWEAGVCPNPMHTLIAGDGEQIWHLAVAHSDPEGWIAEVVPAPATVNDPPTVQRNLPYHADNWLAACAAAIDRFLEFAHLAPAYRDHFGHVRADLQQASVDLSDAATDTAATAAAEPPPAPAPAGPEELSTDGVDLVEVAGEPITTVAEVRTAGQQVLVPADVPKTEDTILSAPPRSLELRRLDRAREILQHKMMTGKPQWRGTDNDLLLLGLIAGVPTRSVAWIDACRAQARDLYIDALRTEVADRVRTGSVMDGRKWPQLPEICHLWGIDHDAIVIEAERAVPE